MESPTYRSRLRQDQALFARFIAVGRDPAERTALVERFMPLARSLAARYVSSREPFEDVLQVACVGLLKAIDRFEPSRGTAFSSYAVPTMVGEIKRHFRDRSWAVRLPRDLQERALAVERAAEGLESRLHRTPTVGELAAAMRLDDEAVLEALHAGHAQRASSLDAPRTTEDEAGETVGDMVGVSEDGFEHAEHRATLSRLMVVLEPQERAALQLRFESELTYEEIGDRIGVSRMQSWRIVRDAMAKLCANAELGAIRAAA